MHPLSFFHQASDPNVAIFHMTSIPSPYCHLQIRAQIPFLQCQCLLFTRYRFIHTLKKASQRQDYQSLVKTHTKQFGSIHNKKQFLVWHRWYLLKMENILREVDPIVTVPYWDWSLWSGEPWLNQVFYFCPLMETWLAGSRSLPSGIPIM